MTNEEKIYSNDYIDLAAVNNMFLDIDFNDGNVFIQYLNNQYAIIHIERTVLQNYNIFYQGYEPFVMGLSQSYLSESGIERVLNQSTLGIDGTGVLIGLIDTGINYRDPAFIYNNNTTKIAACWNQEDREGIPPEGQFYGTEFSRKEINEALENNIAALSINDRSGHGTQLAKIALSAAPQAELLVVKLKPAKQYLIENNFFNADTPAFESTDVMTAMEYIYDKSQQLGKPVSIIIGLGTTQGAHNGTSLLERYINNIASKTGVCVCVAAGNEGVSQHHFFMRADSAMKSIEVSVENSKGFTLWLWNDFICRTAVGVTSPLDEIIQPISPVTQNKTSINLPFGSGNVSIQYQLPVVDKQLTIINVQKPVDGIWKINFSFLRATGCTIEGWLPMSQFISGNVFFLDPSTSTTITVPATANLIIATGGYNSDSGGIYVNTGRGPDTNGTLRPDLTAPAVNVSGNTGTSAAAAITGGAAALLLQWGLVRKNDIRISTLSIKTYLTAGTEQPTTGEGFPNNLWGYGTLNLYNTFRQLL